MVLTQKISEGGHTIPCASWPEGIYHLRLTNALGKVQCAKLIKK